MPDPLFNNRDEEFMQGLMELSGAWANERPEASSTGLIIVGTAFLALAESGGTEMPDEERQKKIRDVASAAFKEFEEGRPQAAFQMVHDALLNPTDGESNE